MTQIKIFEDSDSEHGYCVLDDTVNKWLNDNSHQITVRDIKLHSHYLDLRDDPDAKPVQKQIYTLMVIYDLKAQMT